MRLSYPRTVVWYVEARAGNDPNSAPNMGSAVVVSVRRAKPKDERDQSPQRKYLLTCGHLIRSDDEDGTQGWGPTLEEILVWPPGKGFTRPSDVQGRSIGTSPGAFRARLSDVINDPLTSEQRLPQNDWVLLEVESDEFQAAECVGDIEAADSEMLEIIGYPGGAGGWRSGDLVENLSSGNFTQQRSPNPGMLRLSGAGETRPGMSGGGVFDSVGRLAGLHRSRTVSDLEIGAISSNRIQKALRSAGYEIVSGQPRRKAVAWNRRRFVIGISILSVLALVYFLFFTAAEYSPADFEIVNRRTVVDMRCWRPVPRSMRSMKTSPVIYTQFHTIEKKTAGADTFMKTHWTSGLSLDVASYTHKHDVRRAKGTWSPGETIYNKYELLFDVGEQADYEPFDLKYQAVYWNAFQVRDTESVGATFVHPTRKAVIEVLLPIAIQREDFVFKRERKNQNDEKEIITDPRVTLDGQHLIWQIDNPLIDHAYTVTWKWDASKIDVH